MALPLDCLVANFLACEGRPDTLPDEDIYPLPLDDASWLGVMKSESGSGLLFFAHPGLDADFDGTAQADEESSEPPEEMDVGDDPDGTWMLTADRSNGRYTLWIHADHERVGHAEFARIVDNMRWRFAMWSEVLASRNDSASAVTQGALPRLQELHGYPLHLEHVAQANSWPRQEG